MTKAKRSLSWQQPTSQLRASLDSTYKAAEPYFNSFSDSQESGGPPSSAFLNLSPSWSYYQNSKAAGLNYSILELLQLKCKCFLIAQSLFNITVYLNMLANMLEMHGFDSNSPVPHKGKCGKLYSHFILTVIWYFLWPSHHLILQLHLLELFVHAIPYIYTLA